MKKSIGIFAALMMLTPPVVFAVSASPNVAYLSRAPQYQVLYTCQNAGDSSFVTRSFHPDGTAGPSLSCDLLPDYLFTDTGGNGFYYEASETVVGTYNLIELTEVDSDDCTTLAECEQKPSFVNGIEIFLFQNPGLFALPSGLTGSLSANVSDTIADPGVLLLLGFAIGVPLVFYLIHRTKKVAPGADGMRRGVWKMERNSSGDWKPPRELKEPGDDAMMYAREDVNFVRGFGRIDKDI